MYRLCKAHVILFIRYHEMRWHCCFTVNSSVNAARSYWTNLLAKVPWITHSVKEFSPDWSNQPSWCSGKVKSHTAERSRVQVLLWTVVFNLLSFFFSRFWLVLFAYLFCFSINMYLNNRYLIKCNKQKEKYCVCRAKIVLNILYMDKQSEFLSFPTMYCGKTRVDNHLIIF